MRTKVAVALAVSALVAAACAVTAAARPGATPLAPKLQEIDVDGVKRTGRYYPGAAKVKAVPLVVVFHGHGQSGEIADNLFGIQKAWPEAFVIYPDGLTGVADDNGEGADKPGWQKNPGEPAGSADRDVRLFDRILEVTSKNYKIDPSRIYVVGFSNGARFTYLLWAERRDKIAAVAAFASQSLSRAKLYESFTPMPAMVGQGLRDPNMTFNKAAASFTKVLAVNKNDLAEAKRNVKKIGIFTYAGQAGGAETVQWTHGGGHEPPPNPAKQIVAFFKRH